MIILKSFNNGSLSIIALNSLYKVIPAKAGKFRSRNARRFCSRGYKPRAKRSSII
ncbi:MAG: hypothetical protein ACYCTB_06995 [bacterium]